MKLTTFDELSIAVIAAAWDDTMEFVIPVRPGVPTTAMVTGYGTLYYLSRKCWEEFVASHAKELPFVEWIELRPRDPAYKERKPYPCTWCGGRCAEEGAP